MCVYFLLLQVFLRWLRKKKKLQTCKQRVVRYELTTRFETWRPSDRNCCEVWWCVQLLYRLADADTAGSRCPGVCFQCCCATSTTPCRVLCKDIEKWHGWRSQIQTFVWIWPFCIGNWCRIGLMCECVDIVLSMWYSEVIFLSCS